MSQKVFFYIDQPENIPIGVLYDNITNIDNYTDHSIDHIIINDLLDYYNAHISNQILDLIVRKLKFGGNLEIQGIDLYELSLAISKRQIDTEIAQVLLYRNNRKFIYTMHDIEIILKQLGLDIYNKRYINVFEYYILAKKNEK